MRTHLIGGQQAVRDNPLWWDEAGPVIRSPAIPAQVDVLIVGGGYTGLSAALTLARNGRSVMVSDAGAIGSGASGRNGGFVGAKLRRSLASVAAEYGDRRAVAICTVAKDARGYIEELIRTERIDCDFERCTRFQGAHKPTDFAKLSNNVSSMRRLGFDLEMVERSEQFKFVNSDAYFGGLVDRAGAAFHPSKYLHGLLERAEAAGAIVVAENKVLGADEERTGGFCVRTSKGVVTARDVIVATNGYTDGVFPELQRRIIPIGSYIISTVPLPKDMVRSVMPGCELVSDTRRCASYMRVSPDKTRIVYGGRVAATDISSMSSGPRLKAVLTSIFPILKDVPVSHSWMGFTGFTFDDVPHIGRQRDGIYYAMGYCGSGTSMATYLGHKVALKVLGHSDGRTELDELSFPMKSWYRGSPWFLSGAIAIYRMLDRIHR